MSSCRAPSHEVLQGLGREPLIDVVQILAPYGFGQDSIQDSDIHDYAQVLVPRGTLNVFSELYIWIQDFYAVIHRYFGNAQMLIYADPAQVILDGNRQVFRFKWSLFCQAEWPFDLTTANPATGQWGSVTGHFPRLGQLIGVTELVVPLRPRTLAPRSRYSDFNNKPVLFQVTGSA